MSGGGQGIDKPWPKEVEHCQSYPDGKLVEENSTAGEMYQVLINMKEIT